MAELVLRLRERELSRTPILNTRMTLGRDEASDVVIDNAAVSRTHAILIFVDNQFRLRDADSENGLTVNGKAVKDAVLKYGDVIGIGKFEVVLRETQEQYELQAGAQPKARTAKNVVGTLQMDAASAARMRDEAIAMAAADKAGAAAKPTGPAKPGGAVQPAGAAAKAAAALKTPANPGKAQPASKPEGVANAQAPVKGAVLPAPAPVAAAPARAFVELPSSERDTLAPERAEFEPEPDSAAAPEPPEEEVAIPAAAVAAAQRDRLLKPQPTAAGQPPKKRGAVELGAVLQGLAIGLVLAIAGVAAALWLLTH
jgi:hypothetical protein